MSLEKVGIAGSSESVQQLADKIHQAFSTVGFVYIKNHGIPQEKVTIYSVVYNYVEKADLCKGYQNPKRKLSLTTHFSEIIELKFRKKMLLFHKRKQKTSTAFFCAFFLKNKGQTNNKNAGMTFSRSSLWAKIRQFLSNFYFWTKIVTYALFPPGPSIMVAKSSLKNVW